MPSHATAIDLPYELWRCVALALVKDGGRIMRLALVCKATSALCSDPEMLVAALDATAARPGRRSPDPLCTLADLAFRARLWRGYYYPQPIPWPRVYEDTVRFILSEREVATDSGHQLLCIACKYNQLRVVQMLLEHENFTSGPYGRGWQLAPQRPAVCCAIEARSTEALQLLVRAGASLTPSWKLLDDVRHDADATRFLLDDVRDKPLQVRLQTVPGKAEKEKQVRVLVECRIPTRYEFQRLRRTWNPVAMGGPAAGDALLWAAWDEWWGPGDDV